MRRCFVSVMVLAVLTTAAAGVAFAQTYPTTPPAQSPPSQTAPAQTTPNPSTPGQTTAPGTVPHVAGLKAFTAEADYMSLPGYLRYLMYQQTNQWITYSEATRVAQQQGAL